ncbi:MAG: YfhO family protein [Lachnospiraceae bacterium]|nr:YfhO family protein [Lachnospiraceae bacterium]
MPRIAVLFSDDSKKKTYYAVYSAFFFITAFFCFSWFLFSGRSLIYNDDGWSQYLKALVYYATYLRGIIRHLLYDHRIIVPDWDFTIGEGSDIINALHYYVIGDPLTLLSVFVPVRYMHWFFSFLSILRMYLAGISFSVLCFGTGAKNRYAVLAGSIAYAFCGWALVGAARHPYFINPMILFPLMILGIEKILKKEKSWLFIIVTAASAASNFYFFYMIVLLTVIYFFVRMIFLRLEHHEKVKSIAVYSLKTAFSGALGICLAGIIFLPVIMMFLSDSRISSGRQPFHLFYPLSYYSELPSLFLSADRPYWLCLGFSAPVLISIMLLFLKKKKDVFLKVLFLLCIFIILLPIAGRLLNGMSYMSNRWCWGFCLLCTYILVREWEDLQALTAKKSWQLFVCSIAYYAVILLFDKSRVKPALSAIPMFFISLTVLSVNAKQKLELVKPLLLITVIIAGAVNIAFWKYSPGGDNYILKCLENSKIPYEWENNEARLISEISDTPYMRISGRDLERNANIYYGLSSTQYYWTLSNPYMSKYRSDLSMREPRHFLYEGYDDRTTPTVLSSVRYYSVHNDDSTGMPYGFSFLDKLNSDPAANYYSVFENESFLPPAYCYDRYIPAKTWKDCDPVQKQEIQLEAAYIDAEPDEIEVLDEASPDYQIPYDLKCEGSDISIFENSIITTAKNCRIELTLNTISGNSETYIGFEGLSYRPVSEYDLYFGDTSVDPHNLYNHTNWKMLSKDRQISIKKNRIYQKPVENVEIVISSSFGTEKEIAYLPPDAPFSGGRHDFIANLGYSEVPTDKITITFPETGIYTFSSLNVYSVSMDGFSEKINALKSNTIDNLEFGTDFVSGDISLDSSKLLCMAIPFSKGWEANVDGEKTKVYCLNGRYLGIIIPAGNHKVEFLYHTPYKKAGSVLSICGLAVLAAMILREYLRYKGTAQSV